MVEKLDENTIDIAIYVFVLVYAEMARLYFTFVKWTNSMFLLNHCMMSRLNNHTNTLLLVD